MGIRNFNRLLNIHCPSAHESFNLDRLTKKNIGIDALLFLYEMKMKLKNNNKTFRTVFFEKLNPIILQKPSNVIFVFDGISPPEKSETIMRRRQDKEKLTRKHGPEYQKFIKINQNDIEMYKNIISTTSLFSLIYCKDEAEAALARLNKEGYVDFIFSSDTDLIALQSNYIYKKNYEWIYVNVDTIKSQLGLTKEQLLDLCVLMGNDFNPPLYRIGPITSFQLIKKHKTLENVFKENQYSIYIQNRMLRSRELFSTVLGAYVSNNILEHSINPKTTKKLNPLKKKIDYK